MIRHKWILKVRNTLAELAMECESCAAIEGAKMNACEREALHEGDFYLRNQFLYRRVEIFKSIYPLHSLKIVGVPLG